MPHAVLTAAMPAADPAACLPPPPAATKPRGNPTRGLFPRTIHGNYGVEPSALNHLRRTLPRITRVDIAHDRHQAHLPPTFAARLFGYPPVLIPKLRPRGGITAAEDGAMCHAGAASLAPWRAAVARRAARIEACSTQRAAHAPAADGQTRAARTNASSNPPAPPPVSIPPCSGDSHPERELAAPAAGLRAPANRPPRRAPTPGPTARFKPSRADPLTGEPMAKSATAPFKPFRIDPLNREPTAKPGSTTPFKPSRTDPLNREPTAKSATPSFKPFRIDPLNRAPGAVPNPEPRPVHRVHDPAHIREPTRRAAHTAPAPQARNLCHG
jgi:hypothetical protein